MQNWANVRESRREGAASRYGHFSARESLRRDSRRNQSGSSRENARHSSALRGSSFSPSLPPRERARIELAPRDNTQRATTHCAERKMHARRTKGYKRKRERERRVNRGRYDCFYGRTQRARSCPSATPPRASSKSRPRAASAWWTTAESLNFKRSRLAELHRVLAFIISLFLPLSRSVPGARADVE